MEPQVTIETDGLTGTPLSEDAQGPSVVGTEDSFWDAEVAALDTATDAELMAMAGIDPVVSTSEAAEYFDRTSQWIYWGLKPDPVTGKQVFIWPNGSPIVPERVGNDGGDGRRRFTMPILRAILASCYRRGNIEPSELQAIIRRIRYTELGVEWREREGWVYVDLGRNRHRWVKPDRAVYDEQTQTWKLIKEAE